MAQQSVHVVITGRVQGVGFRFFTRDAAEARRLTGWVRNLPNGGVEAEAEGEKSNLEAWINELRQGPPLARVDQVQLDWRPLSGQFREFSIR
jgi:acylphosphatase